MVVRALDIVNQSKYSSSGIVCSDMVERRRTRKKHEEGRVAVEQEEEEKTMMRWKDKVKKNVKRGWTLDVHLAGIGAEDEQPTPPQQPTGKKEKKKGKEKVKLEKHAGSWVHLGGTCSMPSFDDDEDEGEDVCVGRREAADVAGKERWRRERGAAPPMRW